MAKLAKKHATTISNLFLDITTAEHMIRKINKDARLFVMWAKEHNRACQELKDNYGIEVTQYNLKHLEEVQQ